MGAKIIAAGKYLPPHSIKNEELTKYMDTSDEWIRTRTGIKSRHISMEENTSELCIQAAKAILSKADVSSEKIGFIIVATMTPDAHSPSVAALVQEGIGADTVMAFDISAACSGFVYALSVAEKMMNSGSFEYGLVLAGEVMSKVIDWEDRSTAVLFGDGAGGVLLKHDEHHSLFHSESLHSDGSRGTALSSGFAEVANPFVVQKRDQTMKPTLQMDGRAIFDFVVRTVPKNIRETVEKAELQLEEIDLFLMHQANDRLLKIISKKISLPLDKFASNIEFNGNTSAASIPILLADLIDSGQLSIGSQQKIVLTGFGGGLTWGTLVLEL